MTPSNLFGLVNPPVSYQRIILHRAENHARCVELEFASIGLILNHLQFGDEVIDDRSGLGLPMYEVEFNFHCQLLHHVSPFSPAPCR